MSQRVGRYIAHTRAILKILDYEYNKLKNIYKIRRQWIGELRGYGAKSINEVDPNNLFYLSLLKLESKLKEIHKAKRSIKTRLEHYLEGLDRVKVSVLKHRGQQ